MPNHVTTIINAPKPVIDALVNDEGHVDFARLIPEPANLEQGGCTGTHAPGVICWYSWNTRNWGVKWNAYSTERISDTEVKFDTAWSHPEPIIKALTEKFPTETIEVKYADEDLGYYFAHYTVKDSEVEEHEVPESGSMEAFLWSHQVKYDRAATMETIKEEYADWFEDED